VGRAAQIRRKPPKTAAKIDAIQQAGRTERDGLRKLLRTYGVTDDQMAYKN
jgi:hypothetical protein